MATQKLNQIALVVSDVQRSVDFYQGLFGMPIQARQGSTVLLRIDEGPQFLSLAPVSEAGGSPRIRRYGMSVENFDAEATRMLLAEHGVTPATSREAAQPMQSWIETRGGTPELFLRDPSGVVLQLQDTAYCGGSGPLGDVCGGAVPSPQEGSLRLRDLSHFTLFGPKAQASGDFYRNALGLGIQAYQGPGAAVLGVATSGHFVMAAAAFGANPGEADGLIHHGCFLMEDFDTDRVIDTLSRYGIKPRGDNPTGPMVSYISMRMPNRGGADGGTPELYFTDPDGILLQLQDVSYCGGGGYLGDVCL